MAVAVVHDAFQIGSTEYVPSETGVHIKDSYMILTPWFQYGYCFWLNHVNPETRYVIDGTTNGLMYEWMLHNIAFWGSSLLGFDDYADMAASVDVGETLFSDDHNNWMEHGMKLSYILLDPASSLIDLIINGGYG